MKNTQRKLSLMLSIALGITALSPTLSMAFSENVTAVPISMPIQIGVELPKAQKDYIGGYATVLEVLENQIIVAIKHNSSESDQTYVLNLSDETYVVDNQTGAASSIASILKDDKIYVYHSLATTRSLPPQTAAHVILTNVKENESIATLIDIESITEKDNGSSAYSKDGEYIIHFFNETRVLPFKTKNILHYSDLTQGDRVLVWFDIVSPSLPAQATALKAVILPQMDLNITFAELVRDIIVQIDGEKPMLMDTHYARSYMIKAKELGLITDAQYNDQELWNQNVKSNVMNSLIALVNNTGSNYDYDVTNTLIINQIKVNDKPLNDSRTVVRNGVVMVPLRAVGESLGFEIVWNGSSRSIEILNNDVKSSVQIGYNHYFKENLAAREITEPQQFGSSPLLINGTTYVPSELFNLLISTPAAVSIRDNTINISK